MGNHLDVQYHGPCVKFNFLKKHTLCTFSGNISGNTDLISSFGKTQSDNQSISRSLCYNITILYKYKITILQGTEGTEKGHGAGELKKKQVNEASF